MEALNSRIKKFLSVSSGYGSGYGDGDGYGDGYGDGDGYGYGDGDGYGLKSFCGLPVHLIDCIPTVILSVHGNLAKGFIVNADLTTKQCFVAKANDNFAHGDTFAEAQKALQDKIFESMDTEDRIEAFLEEFKADIKYDAKAFFEWHHKLTGSCEFGRNAFIKDRGIDMSRQYTVKEFIEITRDAYGGEIICQIEERLE